MKGLKEVFSFTLTQQLRSKGYKITTILIALIFFLLPACIMPAVEKFGGDDEVTSTDITTVYTVDLTKENTVDFNVLNMTGNTVFSQISYISCKDDIDQAQALAESDPYSLIMVLDKEDVRYQIHILRAGETELTGDDADDFEAFVNENFRLILIAKSGLSQEQLTEIYTPTYTEITHGTEDTQAEQADPFASIRHVLSAALPYLNIMILYFMVLYYGQGVANNVIMEKTSKLMDTFLVSIKPGAMIFGKVFAIVLSSILQFTLWVVCLIAGFFAGTTFVQMINPDTDMLLIQFFDVIGEFSGLFSIPGIILALLMIFAGFFLYCAIAAIGGSAASKPEDLNSTNMLFTLILLVSFFCTFGSGAMTGNMPQTLCWLDLVPFISILVTPSRILLGTISLTEGLLSFGIVLVVTLVFIWFAGKIYKMMSLYKGNPPKPNELIKMLQNNLTDHKSEA